MERASLALCAVLTFALGLIPAGSAAAADPPASCAGVVSGSVAGQPGVRADIAHGFIAEAHSEGAHTPGGLQSEWARQHQPLEGCLEFITP
jgi:hypothetical protein